MPSHHLTTSMLLVKLLACGAGIGSGLVAARLSLAASRRLADDGLWRRLGAFGRLVLSPDGEDRLLQEYVRLWPVLLAFTAKKLALGLLALAPVALAFGCLTLLDGGLRGAPADVSGAGLRFWPAASDWELPFFAAACMASVLVWLGARFKT